MRIYEQFVRWFCSKYQDRLVPIPSELVFMFETEGIKLTEVQWDRKPLALEVVNRVFDNRVIKFTPEHRMFLKNRMLELKLMEQGLGKPFDLDREIRAAQEGGSSVPAG